jgi:hypothetical protein
MRGPLLAGPIGSPAMLDRVGAIVRERVPVVVLSGLWLGALLATQGACAVLVEAEKRREGRRVLRRVLREGHRLMVVAAGEALPLGAGGAGCIVIENLAEIDDDAEATELLARLALALRPDGLVLALDATKSPVIEARLAGMFLAAALTGIVQERPRDGALLTMGRAAPAPVVAARLS